MSRRKGSTTIRRLGTWWGYRCHYCRELTSAVVPPSHPLRATIEHIVPRCDGGTFAFWNLVIACRQCNNDHGNNPFKCFCETCKDARTWHELHNLQIGIAT